MVYGNSGNQVKRGMEGREKYKREIERAGEGEKIDPYLFRCTGYITCLILCHERISSITATFYLPVIIQSLAIVFPWWYQRQHEDK
jgi:hypothetical protein